MIYRKQYAKQACTCGACSKKIDIGARCYVASDMPTLCFSCGSRTSDRDPRTIPSRNRHVMPVETIVSKPKPVTEEHLRGPECYCAKVNRRCGACEAAVIQRMK